MSDEGEKTCPLCAEEMDLTDQQLKPCKCGYEICVWCWHHLMEMAEKDGTEGRCPACRAPYDKEKIVGTAAKCERVMAGHTVERKRSQKTKSKLSEGRKQLSSVRVIRRNLVYIVGLPLDLADEDLLQCREYFGQYGKVLKVSMSRTAAGVIQQYPNNTCSVYITYSKEEEAICCIQSVHGVTLEGRLLRACFGTTKYCHAWLRNVPCTNPDCLYLHEIGSQEDSFTKDEVKSAFTKNMVQQITSAANHQQRRSGTVLPPPLDHYNSSCSTEKPTMKNAATNLASARGSPPNESFDRPFGLPPAASWAACASNPKASAATSTCSNGPLKQIVDKASSAVTITSVVASKTQDTSSSNDVSDKPLSNNKIRSINSNGKLDMLKSKQYVHSPSTSFCKKPSALDGVPVTAATSDQLLSPSLAESDQRINLPSNASNSADMSAKSSGSGSDWIDHADGNMQYESSDSSSMGIRNEYSGVLYLRPSLTADALIVSENQVQQPSDFGQPREFPNLPVVEAALLPISGLFVSSNQWDSKGDSQNEMLDECHGVEDDILAFNNQRLNDPEVVCPSSHFPSSSNKLSQPNHLGSQSFQHEELGSVTFNEDPISVDSEVTYRSSILPFLGSIISNGVPENAVQSSCAAYTTSDCKYSGNNGLEKHIGIYQGNATNRKSNIDLSGESSIISDILSLDNIDMDTLDKSISSSRNLAQLLGETDGDSGSHSRISSSRNVQNNNQSRFSFARKEESASQEPDVDHLFSVFGQLSTTSTYDSISSGNRDLFLDKLVGSNGFSSNGIKESNNLSNIAVSSNNFPASRAPISAPPGFSVPSRAPPPGFTSHERLEHAYDTARGNHVLGASSMLRNSYHPPNGNIGNANDSEFHDPAILEIVENGVRSVPNNSVFDVRSSYHQQFNNSFEHEARLQLLMQRSVSQPQNFRYPDTVDSYSHVNNSYGIPSRFLNQSQVNLSNSYGIPSRLLDQSQLNSMTPFGQPQMENGQWNEVQGFDQSQLNSMSTFGHPRLQQSKSAPTANGQYSMTPFGQPQMANGQWNEVQGFDQSQLNSMSTFGHPRLQQSKSSPTANGQWNEVQGGINISIAELLRNERLRYNKFYPSYEDTKFCMPSPDNLQNRTFGM